MALAETNSKTDIADALNSPESIVLRLDCLQSYLDLAIEHCVSAVGARDRVIF